VLEDLSLLLDLQKIDNQINDALKLKDQIPKDLELCRTDQTKAEENLKQKEDLLFEKQKTRRTLEGDLEAENGTLKRYQRQLFDVRDNKEYQAMLREIEGKKQRISRLEEQILMVLEEIDECTSNLEEAKQSTDTEKARCEARESELRRQDESLAETLVIREDERKRVAARMKPDLLARYERIRKGRGGVAVVTIDGGTCPGCFTALPPQFVNEIRKATQILPCEHCGRILIWQSDG
jgi:predicted  nucleic acid-binding Zn-ribbon protein